MDRVTVCEPAKTRVCRVYRVVHSKAHMSRNFKRWVFYLRRSHCRDNFPKEFNSQAQSAFYHVALMGRRNVPTHNLEVHQGPEQPIANMSATKQASSEPLLATMATPIMEPALFHRFQRSSLFLGLLVGLFIQASTLGANYLVVSVWGEEVVNTTKQDVIYFSLVWSLFTSALAIVILAFLRNLVQACYQSDDEERNDLLDDMILQMECRFVVGALIGVCSAWALTDLVLGMSMQIVYSVVTLVVALSWCRIMMWCFTEKRSKKTAEVLMVV